MALIAGESENPTLVGVIPGLAGFRTSEGGGRDGGTSSSGAERAGGQNGRSSSERSWQVAGEDGD